DEDRDVADQTDLPRGAVVAEERPLAVELELHELMEADVAREFSRRLANRRWPAEAKIAIPIEPLTAAECALERAEEREVVEPGAMIVAELLKCVIAFELRIRPAEQHGAKSVDGGVLDAVARERPRRTKVLRSKQPLFRQPFEADQPRTP